MIKTLIGEASHLRNLALKEELCVVSMGDCYMSTELKKHGESEGCFLSLYQGYNMRCWCSQNVTFVRGLTFPSLCLQIWESVLDSSMFQAATLSFGLLCGPLLGFGRQRIGCARQTQLRCSRNFIVTVVFARYNRPHCQCWSFLTLWDKGTWYGKRCERRYYFPGRGGHLLFSVNNNESELFLLDGTYWGN